MDHDIFNSSSEPSQFSIASGAISPSDSVSQVNTSQPLSQQSPFSTSSITDPPVLSKAGITYAAIPRHYLVVENEPSTLLTAAERLGLPDDVLCLCKL